MQRWTFAVVAWLACAGCGSGVATRGVGAAPNAPPIAAAMARSPDPPGPPDPQDPRSPSRVMAYVEGEVITYREILQRKGPELAELESPADKAQMEQHTLMEIIRDRMIYRAAIEAGVGARVTRDDLDAERTKLVRKLAKSGGTLEAFLHERDMTRREYDEFNRVQIVNHKYRYAAIGHNTDPGVRVRAVTDTYVAPEEVRKYYDRHHDQFDEAPGARCRMLIIKTDLEAPDRVAAVAAARAVAESAVARLKGGDGREPEDWVPVYRELNKSPADPLQPDGLCSIERGKKADWIEKFAFESEKGAVLLKEMGTTFYVLQAEGAHDARVIPFQDAAEAIRAKLENARVMMAFLEVDLSVLNESSVQPESVRADLQNSLRVERRMWLEQAER